MSLSASIAVIIPVWHHSALVSEAVASCLDQSALHIILVNDGCDYAQTRDTLAGWAARHPDRITLLTRPNGGLSAARNTGIDSALAHMPALKGLYFLDADNRLDPHAGTLFKTLLASADPAGWFYPQFDMFGVEQNRNNGGDFALSRLAFSNYCDAGSLVRRAVFDTGLRFDTDFRAGYEDWDFWLSCARDGFHGAPVKTAFLRYRKRPESMLSGAHRTAIALQAQLAAKHGWLFNTHRLTDAWLAEFPRFAFFDKTGVTLSALPEGADPVAPADYARRFFATLINPFESALPDTLVFAKPGAFAHLQRYKLLESVLYQLEGALRHTPFAGVRFSSGDLSVAPLPVQRDTTGELLEGCDILMLSRHHLAAALAAGDTGEMIEYLVAGVLLETLAVSLPEPFSHDGSPLGDMVEVAGTLSLSPYVELGKDALTNWRAPADVHWPDGVAREVVAHNAGRPALRPKPAGRHVGFVLPVFRFGGAEKCVVALAAELQKSGITCHLYIYGTDRAAAADWLIAPFETIHMLTDAQLRNWDGGTYLGTWGSARPDDQVLGDMTGPLTGLDAVVNCGSGALTHALGSLRARGIKTLTWEHLTEQTPYGRSFGTPYLAVAHEAAYDTILTCSNQLADRIAGQGVPRAKLLPLPNGPGFPDVKATAQKAAHPKGQRGQRLDILRVGFLGRFDRQKGIDRFIDIATRLRDLPFSFSVRGGAVMASETVSIPDWIDSGPPLYDPAELAAFYAGIDVLVLPSRGEGLPLTILEAQRAGVVPLASDVGAVAEAIEHGVNGLLLPPDRVVEAAVEHLRELAVTAQTLSALRKGMRAKPDQWQQNARSFTRNVFGATL